MSSTHIWKTWRRDQRWASWCGEELATRPEVDADGDLNGRCEACLEALQQESLSQEQKFRHRTESASRALDNKMRIF